MVGDGGHLLVYGRPYRSKWWQASCSCPKSKRRKDGTCKHLRAFYELAKLEVRPRLKLSPYQTGKEPVPPPPRDTREGSS